MFHFTFSSHTFLRSSHLARAINLFGSRQYLLSLILFPDQEQIKSILHIWTASHATYFQHYWSTNIPSTIFLYKCYRLDFTLLHSEHSSFSLSEKPVQGMISGDDLPLCHWHKEVKIGPREDLWQIRVIVLVMASSLRISSWMWREGSKGRGTKLKDLSKANFVCVWCSVSPSHCCVTS